LKQAKKETTITTKGLEKLLHEKLGRHEKLQVVENQDKLEKL
jgi:hypothetical protein